MDAVGGSVVQQRAHGAQVSTEVRLADGSTIGVLTGLSPWVRAGAARTLQMWVGGEVVLDSGPLSPAAARFLDDLRIARSVVGPQAVPGFHGGPLSQWLAQRATLDPSTHRIDHDGAARPLHEAGEVLVWDAVQGWVPARTAGDLAAVVAQTFVPRSGAQGPHEAGTVAAVLEAAAELPGAMAAGRAAELQAAATGAGGVDDARREARDRLGFATDVLATVTAPWALTEVLGLRASPVFAVGGRVLVQLANGQVAVVAEATSESAVLRGSRPGLVQAGTTGDLGAFRNELFRAPGGHAAAELLTQALVDGAVRHFRVQGVVSATGFAGARVVEFAVRPRVPAGVGVDRADVDPQRHFGPGPGAELAMAEAAARDVVPADPAQRVARGFRLLGLVNPLERAFQAGDQAAVPFRNNCGDVSRAVADLFLGRAARVARGDNAARLTADRYTKAGLRPAELPEMYSCTGASPDHYLVRAAGGNPAVFTSTAWRSVARAMHGAPVGAVAVVLVNWGTSDGRFGGGHWFNAVQAGDGLHWVDGQSNHAAPWADGPPYGAAIELIGAVVCSGPGEPWRDLRVVHGGPSWGTSGGAPAGNGPVHGMALPAHAVEPDDEGRPTRAIDWSLVVALANATGGELPDDDPVRLVHPPVGAGGRTTIEVGSPRGDVVPIGVRWVDGYPPALVLSQLPGATFWWDVPAAVHRAVVQGLQVVAPDVDRGVGPVVLGRRPGPDGHVELVRFPVDLLPAGPVLAGPPTLLSGPEAARARAAFGLDD